MAKKQKEYWYVLVMTMEGAKFVTSVNLNDNTAKYDGNEKPKRMIDKEDASYLAIGLTVNGMWSFPVCTGYEIDKQPFRYDLGHFVWEENK